MYGWLWHHLPGPRPIRVGTMVLLALAALVVLFAWVFPWVDSRLPPADVTVDTSGLALSTQLSTGGDRITALRFDGSS